MRAFVSQAEIAIENVRPFNETKGSAGPADRNGRDPASRSAARPPTRRQCSTRSQSARAVLCDAEVGATTRF